MYSRLCLHKSDGQTLIEVLVALSTAVVLVSAITLAIITALRNVEYTKTQNQATRFAQEGMEFIRFTRDANYNQFNQLSGNYCLNKGATFLSPLSGNSCGTNVNIFSRLITITKNSAECDLATPVPPFPPTGSGTQVKVVVSWTDSNCQSSQFCHESKLISCLSDYPVVPTPGDNVTPTPTPTP